MDTRVRRRIWCGMKASPGKAGDRRAVPSPAATAVLGSGNLTSVSCLSAHRCIAVGTHLTSGPAERGYTRAEAWNGKTWTVLPTPNPRASSDSNLFGVSCSSPRACVAVGGYDTGQFAPQLPLAESWNGTTWTIIRTRV